MMVANHQKVAAISEQHTCKLGQAVADLQGRSPSPRPHAGKKDGVSTLRAPGHRTATSAIPPSPTPAPVLAINLTISTGATLNSGTDE